MSLAETKTGIKPNPWNARLSEYTGKFLRGNDYAQIGTEYGVSKQAVHQAFGRLAEGIAGRKVSNRMPIVIYEGVRQGLVDTSHLADSVLSEIRTSDRFPEVQAMIQEFVNTDGIIQPGMSKVEKQLNLGIWNLVAAVASIERQTKLEEARKQG